MPHVFPGGSGLMCGEGDTVKAARLKRPPTFQFFSVDAQTDKPGGQAIHRQAVASGGKRRERQTATAAAATATTTATTTTNAWRDNHNEKHQYRDRSVLAWRKMNSHTASSATHSSPSPPSSSPALPRPSPSPPASPIASPLKRWPIPPPLLIESGGCKAPAAGGSSTAHPSTPTAWNRGPHDLRQRWGPAAAMAPRACAPPHHTAGFCGLVLVGAAEETYEVWGGAGSWGTRG